MTPTELKQAAEKWPIKNEFFVEIEDHSEDGSWSGYAHSEEFPKGSDSRKAVLLEPNTIQVPRELWEEIIKALELYQSPDKIFVTVWEDESKDGHCWLEPAKEHNLIEEAEECPNTDFGITAMEALDAIKKAGL